MTDAQPRMVYVEPMSGSNRETGNSFDDGVNLRQSLNTNMGQVLCLPDGTIYLIDLAKHRIRKVVPSGTITTVAGTAVAGYNGDGIPATGAQLNGPSSIAVAADGTLYIADVGNARIRAVDPATGTIRTVAGNGGKTIQVDGEATSVPVPAPNYLALGDDGTTLYFVDTYSELRWTDPDHMTVPFRWYQQRVRRLQAGRVETLAGGAPVGSREVGSGAAVNLWGISGLVVNQGALYLIRASQYSPGSMSWQVEPAQNVYRHGLYQLDPASKMLSLASESLGFPQRLLSFEGRIIFLDSVSMASPFSDKAVCEWKDGARKPLYWAWAPNSYYKNPLITWEANPCNDVVGMGIDPHGGRVLFALSETYYALLVGQRIWRATEGLDGAPGADPGDCDGVTNCTPAYFGRKQQSLDTLRTGNNIGHNVYEHDLQIWYRYRSSGETDWSTPVRVSTGDAHAIKPGISPGEDGSTLFIDWEEPQTGLTRRARSTDRGQTWQAVV